MNDRTLLHLVLVLAVFSLAINGFTLREVSARASQAPPGTPPPNDSTLMGPGAIPCFMDCTEERRACDRTCTACQETRTGFTCRKRCDADLGECVEPCYVEVENAIEILREMGQWQGEWNIGDELHPGVHQQSFRPCLPCLEKRNACMEGCFANEEACPDTACGLCEEKERTCRKTCYYDGSCRKCGLVAEIASRRNCEAVGQIA